MSDSKPEFLSMEARMSDRVYGVLLVSFSHHSHQRSFIQSFIDHPRIRIIGVADDMDIDEYLRPLNHSWADKLGVPYFEPIDEAVKRADVDIVSIGHEIERRSHIAVMAAGAGKHLWIDKFIGANLDECNSVVEAVDKAGVKSILPSYVYNDLVRQSQQVIDSCELGDLLGIHVDIMFNKGKPAPISVEIRNATFLPPGQWKFPEFKRELLTIGAYAIGLITRCFDKISEVYGQGDAYFFPVHAKSGAEDFGVLTLIDEKGRVGTISSGRIGVGSHAIGGPNQAVLFGTKGTARVDGGRPRLDSNMRSRIIHADYEPPDEDPMQWASSPPSPTIRLAEDPMALALIDLIRAIDNDQSTLFTVKDARDHMGILLAGYHAIVQNKSVRLPLMEEVPS
jgi:predicted dehydrogenase